MNITSKGFTALILSLLLLLVCLPAAVFGEEVNETTQEIFVTNTPIKGKIVLEKTGMVLLSKVGGASGPLYGTAYMKAAKATAGKTALTVEDATRSYVWMDAEA